MDTENESLPTGERASVEQQAGNAPLVEQPVKPVPHLQRISRFLEDIRPTPGSNVTRIYGLSDCVIAVAFTLVIVNIRLPPEGLNESQLQSFITHNILSDEIPFVIATYLVVASSWISHYRIVTYLKHSNSLFLILNVLFLASIVFLPVPVAFFYQYGNQLGSLLVFACTQLVTSLTLLLMWGVARVDHLLDPATTSRVSQIHDSTSGRYSDWNPFRHWRRLLQRLVSRGYLALLLHSGLVPTRTLLSPSSESRLPGGNRPHVLDY